MLSDDIWLGLLNLHDAFLNASVVQVRMLEAHVETNAALFHASDRARLERLWVTLLAVLIEAWQASQMRPVRDYIASVASVGTLVGLLRQSRKDGHDDKLTECRHYMFHRDRRQYWDDGRASPIGELEFHLRLHQAFSDVLLAAMGSANAERALPSTSRS